MHAAQVINLHIRKKPVPLSGTNVFFRHLGLHELGGLSDEVQALGLHVQRLGLLSDPSLALLHDQIPVGLLAREAVLLNERNNVSANARI